MFRFVPVFILISSLHAQTKIDNYIPFLEEISKIDTSFTYRELENTIYLQYGKSGHRIEIVNNRLKRITPLNQSGQINGYQKTFHFSRKNHRWPSFNIDYYSSDAIIERNIFPLRVVDLDSIDLSYNYLEEKTLFEKNDSINESESSWWISDEIGMPHRIEIGGQNDSVYCYVSFYNGYFHIIGFKDLRNGKKKKQLYLFDENKLILKLNMSDTKLDGSQTLFYNQSQYDFNCHGNEYECYCSESISTDTGLFDENSKYFYLINSFGKTRVQLSSYTYYTLLKFENTMF